MRARASGFSGGLRIGADFFARRGWEAEGAPRGVVDHLQDLSHPGVDVETIDPRVAAFFVDTAGLELHIRSRWVFPFSLLWSLAFHVARGLGQFVYPRREGRVLTRAFAVDRAKDGRDDARGIVRTYRGSGDVMQAVAYATWARDGSRFMSAAFPLLLGRLMGLLRLDALGAGGAVLSSRAGRDAGVWFVLGPVAIPLPLSERLELWPPGAAGAPAEPAPEGVPAPTILGRHEQRLCGVLVVTHHYWFWPTDRGETS